MGLQGRRINKLQQRILDSMLSNDYVFINTHNTNRGRGISTIIANYLLWEISVYYNISNLLIVPNNHHYAYSKDMYETAYMYLRNDLARTRGSNIISNEYNKTMLEWETMSSVYRGYRIPYDINTICIDDPCGAMTDDNFYRIQADIASLRHRKLNKPSYMPYDGMYEANALDRITVTEEVVPRLVIISPYAYSIMKRTMSNYHSVDYIDA